jgi:hypothetical protein
MSKPATILISLVTLLVGILVGGWTANKYHRDSNTRLILGNLNAEACSTVFTLQFLQTGRTTNAVAFLEEKLDCDLIGFSGIMLAEPHELNRDPSYLTTFEAVKEYRTRFPHKSDSPEIDAEADKAFDLLNGQTKH